MKKMQLETLPIDAADERLPGELLFRHSARILGSRVAVTYALNLKEHRRRMRLDFGALEHEATLAALLDMPTDDLSPIAPRFEHLLEGHLDHQAVAVTISDVDNRRWGRRLLQVPVRLVGADIAEASPPRAMATAHRWNGYTARWLTLPRAPRNSDLFLLEASHYGVGVRVAEGDDYECRELVQPVPYSPRRLTAARWALSELVYGQFLTLTNEASD